MMKYVRYELFSGLVLTLGNGPNVEQFATNGSLVHFQSQVGRIITRIDRKEQGEHTWLLTGWSAIDGTGKWFSVEGVYSPKTQIGQLICGSNLEE